MNGDFVAIRLKEYPLARSSKGLGYDIVEYLGLGPLALCDTYADACTDDDSYVYSYLQSLMVEGKEGAKDQTFIPDVPTGNGRHPGPTQPPTA